MIITLPTGMELLDWSSQVIIDLDAYGSFGRLQDPDRWQDWGVQFLNNTTIGRNLPNPYGFTDWKEWAERLVGALS
ncbi:MAG: hypothetical protein RL758_215 [Pseudomonadota bacterium]|jgi:hypothetical protein